MRDRNRRDLTAWWVGVLGCAFLFLSGSAVADQPQGDDEMALSAAEAARYEQQTLRVNVWVDKPRDAIYKRGEVVEVGFQANEDAYAVVYRIDADGLVTILWPTSRFSDGFVFGRHEYRLPAQGGPRLRAASSEGVGYIQALVSRYPFDLRDLDVDFHHEMDDRGHDFYVVGDPFLAMNEVNFAVTGLEDPGEYVVTNYTSYYVHREVDHPRYLCLQCHTDQEVAYEPYRDTCTVNIRYDYGWTNDWYVRFGYYPAYYYPVYYYVDPWTWSPWVNYWYRPWYRWPGCYVHHWDYHCYDWHHSPYWSGDSVTAWKHDRRYQPLDKTNLARDGRPLKDASQESRLVRGGAPGESRIADMRNRTVRSSDDAAVARGRSVPAGGTPYRDVDPVARPRSKFAQDDRVRTSPGLRVPERGDGSAAPTTTRGTRPGFEDSRDGSRVSPPPVAGPRVRTTGDAQRRSIRPVSPRDGDTRVWSSRRTNEDNSRAVGPRSAEPRSRDDRSGRYSKPAERRESSPAVRRGGASGGASSRRDSGQKVRSGGGSSSREQPRSSSGSRSSGGSSRGGGSSGGGSSSGSRGGGSGRSGGRG